MDIKQAYKSTPEPTVANLREITGWSGWKVRDQLKKADLKPLTLDRNRGNRKDDSVIAAYHSSGLKTLKDIADIASVSVETARAVCKRNNLTPQAVNRGDSIKAAKAASRAKRLSIIPTNSTLSECMRVLGTKDPHDTRKLLKAGGVGFIDEVIRTKYDSWVQGRKDNMGETIQGCADNWGTNYSTARSFLNEHNIKVNRWEGRTSMEEARIGNLLDQLGVEYTAQAHVFDDNRKTVDFLVGNLVIEYHGIAFHSENGIFGEGKGRMHHVERLNELEAKGYRVIQIMSYESWDIWASKLAYMLGFCDLRIAARKCRVQSLTVNDTRRFLDDNHLQGFTGASSYHGLYQGEKLVAVMSWKGQELSRYATKRGYCIQGGFTKLLKHTKPQGPVFTFADRRYSIAGVYQASGFKLDNISAPNYKYWKGVKVYSRQQFMKSKLANRLQKFDPKLTEWENMQANGYNRIWDCGNYRLTLEG